MITQQAVNALVIGAVYALFGLGFNLVLGALNILNIAHAGVFAVGAWTAFVVASEGYPIWAAFLMAMLVGGLVDVAVNEFVLAPLRRRGGTGLVPLVNSLGANIIIITGLQVVSKARVERLPADAFPSTSFHLIGARISLAQIVAIAAAAAAVGLTYAVLHRTQWGRAIRAVEFDEEASQMIGIPADRTVRRTFMLSGALAGLAGILTALLFNTVHFRIGESYLLKGFIVIVIGGFGSVPGTVLAALMLGVIEMSAIAMGLGAYRDAVSFGFLILVLLIRPHGLFSEPARQRA